MKQIENNTYFVLCVFMIFDKNLLLFLGDQLVLILLLGKK